MASTSLTLGAHWEAFIKDQVQSGRYSTASEVVRAALRTLQDYDSQIAALRSSIQPGIDEANSGEFIETNPDEIVSQAKLRTRQQT